MARLPRWSLVPVVVLAVCLTWLGSPPANGSTVSYAQVSPLSPLAYLPLIDNQFNPLHHGIYLPTVLR